MWTRLKGCFDLSGLHGSPPDKGLSIPTDWVRHKNQIVGLVLGKLFPLCLEVATFAIIAPHASRLTPHASRLEREIPHRARAAVENFCLYTGKLHVCFSRWTAVVACGQVSRGHEFLAWVWSGVTNIQQHVSRLHQLKVLVEAVAEEPNSPKIAWALPKASRDVQPDRRQEIQLFVRGPDADFRRGLGRVASEFFLQRRSNIIKVSWDYLLLRQDSLSVSK